MPIDIIELSHSLSAPYTHLSAESNIIMTWFRDGWPSVLLDLYINEWITWCFWFYLLGWWLWYKAKHPVTYMNLIYIP